jgi:hypothetical protein
MKKNKNYWMKKRRMKVKEEGRSEGTFSCTFCHPLEFMNSTVVTVDTSTRLAHKKENVFQFYGI